jgi:tetratricopeptide (TPR) repeat protein
MARIGGFRPAARRVGWLAAILPVLAAAGATPAAAMSQAASQQAVQYQIKHDWAGLAALAAKAIAADAKDGWAWFYAGLADDGLGRKADAVKAYEAALPLMAGYLQQNVIQLLAADYAALNEADKLLALYQAALETNPPLAESLRQQFGAAFAKSLPWPGGETLPDISADTLAALTAKVRQSWRKDAVPMLVSVANQRNPAGGGAFGWYVDYESPSARAGLTVTPEANGSLNTMAVANPNWGALDIPGAFLSLAQAFALVPGGNPPDALQNAVLARNSPDPTDPANLYWEMGISGAPNGANVPAYILTKDEVGRLLAAAQGGNADAEYLLAVAYEVGTVSDAYATGILAPPDFAKAAAWLAKSASQGSYLAEDKLGQYYQFGIVVAADPARAAGLYLASAKANYGPASYNLAVLREIGAGVTQDWDQAEILLAAAAQQGSGPAAAELAIVKQADRRLEHQRALSQKQQQTTLCLHGSRLPGQQCTTRFDLEDVIHSSYALLVDHDTVPR